MKNNTYIYYIFILLIVSLNLSYSSPKWYIEVVDDTYCVGDSSSIKLDSKGYPHISYNEYNYDGELRYAYFDGSKWYYEVVDTNGDISHGTSIALDKNDNPHIAYCDRTNNAGGLKYAYFDGNKWSIEMVDNGYGIGFYCSIALDSIEHPHISYRSGSDENLKYAYFDGTKWNIEVVDSNGRVGWYTSIAIDKNDHPHISYTDMTNNKPKYAYFDGTKWNIEVIDTNSNSGRCTSIALDKEGNPHVAYAGVGLKYAYKYQSNWVIEEVDNDHIGGDISLCLDSIDFPHISYNYWDDYGPEKLMYVYFDGKEWHKEVVDVGTNVAIAGTSIAIDNNNFPHISYNDADNLRYARYGYGVGIDLTSFTAKPNNNAITLNWSVSTDENITGFNLYRRITPTGVIHELPIQYTSVGAVHELPTTVGEDLSQRDPVLGDDNPCPDTDAQWTKVNTSLITGTNPYSYTDRNIASETTYEYKLEAVVSDRNETLGTTQCTSGNSTPSSFEITKVYPTPATSQISIDIVIPEQSDIDIAIYDITGRKVSTVASGLYSPGEYTLLSDLSGLTNGVYIVRMTTEGLSASKNFVIVR
jgi:hypothetical protein